MASEALRRGMGREAEEMESTAAPGRTVFLGIGINEYDEFPPLQNAVRDVEAISALLQEKYSIDEVRLLLDREAQREHIITALDQLVKNLDEDDRLLIYYSGHGHYQLDTERGFWIPSDAERDNTANYIRNGTLRDYLQDIKARHILLISDSCFSGSLLVRGASRSGNRMEELESKASRWVFCSGRHDEEVYDGPPDGHSPFSQSILDVLSQNQQARLNIARLADEVQELTRSDYTQLPEGAPMYGTHRHKGGQFVFRLKGVAPVTSLQEANSTAARSSTGEPVLPSQRITLVRWFGWMILTWVVGILIIALLGMLNSTSLNNLLVDTIFPLFILLGPVVATWRSRLSRTTLRGLQIGGILLFLIFVVQYVLNSENTLNNPIYLRIAIWAVVGGGVFGWLLPRLR